ncbi:hypothetical protein UNSWDHB_875 [Dehalobacter sp. UNSWDHB]|uniref:LCP family protein n=1 Tax=unclassified Dehalobacter TaxID=2635733 RepID=UPI00028ADC69|nr:MULTISPECIES: LCP family protein [unclassified Dehalobacter]AFV02528.1 Cell envelope-associated transcriptional attenuator LytR-CpsA-Psr, subfamily M [Dehalobacter sp. DCA]AFV05517.1 Cell envelope-associated transcriptional attenuator LytR-CpsA-Psr, subfamily M [Dehalobacter sp. CF]EQB21777.1 hypothetical protein UNSWDHB_875 [Dehalobacter sp. UNSWDHB]
MRKKKNTKRKAFTIIAVLLAGIIAGSAAFGYFFLNQGSTGAGGSTENSSTDSLNKRISFLLIGADKRPGQTSYNTDTIIVASVDPDTKLISLLSIPRDTRVSLPGSNSYVKINSVVMYRGIPELMDEVTELTGILLDGYVVTNFDGFKSIIDTVDGIELDVEMDMYKETGDEVDGVIDLKAGEQHLNGTQALQYARFRGDSTADIGRTARQQKVLKAVAKAVLQPSTIIKLPKLIPQINEVVETDLKLADILRLSKAAAAFDSSNMVNQTLPGYGLYLDNISYWEVNPDHAKQVAKNLLLGITTDITIDGTVLDLLSPELQSHITVPGSSSDPNGTASPGHDDSGSASGNSEDPSGAELNDGSTGTSDGTGTDIGQGAGSPDQGNSLGQDESNLNNGNASDKKTKEIKLLIIPE